MSLTQSSSSQALFACTRCNSRHPFEELSQGQQLCKVCPIVSELWPHLHCLSVHYRNVAAPSLSSNARIVELSSNRRANPVLYRFARNASKTSNSSAKYVLLATNGRVLLGSRTLSLLTALMAYSALQLVSHCETNLQCFTVDH